MTSVLVDRSHDGFAAVGDALGAINLRISALEKSRINVRSSNQSSTTSRNNCACALRIIVDNYLDDAVMSVSPDAYETLPLANVLVPEREDVMMTQSRSEHVITGDFSKRRVVNAFVIALHNFSVRGKIRLELFSDKEQGGDLNYDSGYFFARQRIPIQQLRIGIDPWGAMYGNDLAANTPHWFDSVFAKSFRITLFDVESPDESNYLSIGNMIMGRYWAPETTNFAWGASIQWMQGVTHVRSEGKTLHSEGTADKYRRVKFDLNNLSETDATLFYEFVREYGGLKEFFISMYPESTHAIRQIEHGFIGRFTDELPTRTHSRHRQYQAPIVIEEI